MIKLQMGLFEGAFMLHFPAIATGQMVHWLCKHIIIRDSHVQQEGHPLSSPSWVTYRTQRSKTSM